MKKITFLFSTFACLFFCTSTTNAQWQTVGNAGFSKNEVYTPSLAVNGNTPYVAYSDSENGGKITVMKFDGINWGIVGNAGFSVGYASDISLAFNGSTPCVAYSDGGNNYKATVMKFDGTNWITVGKAGFSAGKVGNISLTTSNGNTPYVAYSDSINTVMKFDGTNWVIVGNAGFSTANAGNISLALNGNTPYVAYSEFGTNRTDEKVMKFDGTNWVTVGSKGFTNFSSFNSLKLNGSTPYVAYMDMENYKATVKKFDGTNWVTVGSVGGFSIGSAWNTTLAFNDTTPYVAYRDDGDSAKTMVMKFDGTNWVSLGNAACSPNAGWDPFLAINNNTVYVVYSDGGNGGKATVRKYALPCAAPAAPINNTTTSNLTICKLGTTTMNASGIGTLSWYDAATGGNYLGGGVNYTTPVLTGNTTYYVQDSTCAASATRTAIAVTVTTNTTPTVTTITPASRCDVGIVVLGATATSGTLNWYAASAGGVSIGTGTNYTTPTISATTNYYVEATNNGCTSSRTEVTATINPPSSCEPVWPGDANHDGIANNFDLLAIGVAYNANGSVRAGASLNWIGQPAADWADTLKDGTNFKHTDCDGNGVVYVSDIAAILQNYKLTHNKTFAVNSASASDPALSLNTANDTVSSGAAVTVQIELGNIAVPANNVYGFAFTINFDPTLVDSASLGFDILNSWLGTKNTNLMALDYNNFSNGSIDIAVTRNDHNNANGYGTIGELSFKTSNNFTGNKALNLSVSNVKMISNNETALPVNLGTDAVIVTGLNTVQQKEIAVKILPNPFHESATVFIEGLNSNEALSFELYDIIGKKVKQINNISTKQFTITKENLQSGIYFYKVFSSKEFISTGRVVVE